MLKTTKLTTVEEVTIEKIDLQNRYFDGNNNSIGKIVSLDFDS